MELIALLIIIGIALLLGVLAKVVPGGVVLFYIAAVVIVLALGAWGLHGPGRRRKDWDDASPDPAQDGDDAMPAPGVEGEAVTPLKPHGSVVISGQRHAAKADVGYIEAGAPVRVVGRESGEIVVTPSK